MKIQLKSKEDESMGSKVIVPISLDIDLFGFSEIFLTTAQHLDKASDSGEALC